MTVRRGGGPTMQDVGKLAQVSAMTVSRVLKNDPGVSEATRARVFAAVDRLGYRRNETARSLRLGGSGMIGLVVTNLANPFYSRLALGVQDVATEYGFRVVLSNSAEQADREPGLVDGLVDHQVEGLIVVPAGSRQQHLAEAMRRVPVVLAARPPAGLDTDCVLVEDFHGAREATACLLAEGHTRIAFLGNPPALYTGAERLRGFWAAHEEAGVEPDHALIRQGLVDAATAELATADLLAGPAGPTALFCTNNRISQGAIRAMYKAGTSVPLAGFDDFDLSDVLGLPLTLVSYDADEIGRQAARLLIDRLDQRDAEPRASRRVTVPTRVVRHGPLPGA
ncbi:LacI family DNA-binding transcriptional regulator [Actinacidiphila sp. DG2A-62]|uniref:LacI family DNA-binding transcriptional regulator n=1 Tax=Actinacidiphila sp. DG2A-62 TaxID=3108821 RepID=UPI002DB5BB4F|nr:LacI family DNA-binding transcriptional regulator [Actinacidiphila sp. DG2A-62]MEC3992559.1 LacI family DNA-binding transcriptional regulator [Actinacidiphila sp. DG2A-62]